MKQNWAKPREPEMNKTVFTLGLHDWTHESVPRDARSEGLTAFLNTGKDGGKGNDEVMGCTLLPEDKKCFDTTLAICMGSVCWNLQDSEVRGACGRPPCLLLCSLPISP